MNGVPLPNEHGAPVRLIAPGWYGVANVKWLTRIEVIDRRFTGRFMARDYVTFRESNVGGETVWSFTNVGQARLKSAPAKVTRRAATTRSSAWRGVPRSPGSRSQSTAVHGNPLRCAVMTATKSRGRAWPGSSGRMTGAHHSAGSHTVASRAIDIDGDIQPAPDDPYLASRRTYWENNGQITRTVLIT